MARANLAASGAPDRVEFHHRDAASVEVDTGYDLVCAFECVHDMPRPGTGEMAVLLLAIGNHGAFLHVDVVARQLQQHRGAGAGPRLDVQRGRDAFDGPLPRRRTPAEGGKNEGNVLARRLSDDH